MSLKTAENSNFWAQVESFGFSIQNTMLKILRGFNFASQQSHTFSRVLISRKWQKFAKLQNLMSRKLFPLKYQGLKCLQRKTEKRLVFFELNDRSQNLLDTYHICNFIFFPSISTVLILKSIPVIRKSFIE